MEILSYKHSPTPGKSPSFPHGYDDDKDNDDNDNEDGNGNNGTYNSVEFLWKQIFHYAVTRNGTNEYFKLFLFLYRIFLSMQHKIIVHRKKYIG